MSAAKHTPGPLQVRIAANGDVAVLNERKDIVAECFADIRHERESARDEALANATLYAAAENLLELVRISIGNVRSLGPAGALGDLPHAPYREWLAQLEAAYAKATGAPQTTECTCAAQDMPFGRCCKAAGSAP